MKYSNEELLKMYESLAEARSYSVQMKGAVAAGYVRCAHHNPWGEEAVGVGMAYAMDDKVWYVATHRSQIQLYSRVGMYDMTAEMFCRKTGPRKGVAYDAHYGDFSKKLLVQCALIGANTPLYTGFAWALKKKAPGECVVIEMGDGACSEGCSWEAWNLAKLYEAPVCYVITNNQWAMSVHQPDETPNPNISEKIAPIGLKTKIVDGNNLLAVREAIEEGIALAKKNIPNVVELKTLRWGPHLIGQREYERPDKELLEYAIKHDDPLVRYEYFLKEEGLAGDEYFNNVKAEVEARVHEIIERAGHDDFASFDEIYSKNFVFANPETGGDL